MTIKQERKALALAAAVFVVAAVSQHPVPWIAFGLILGYTIGKSA